MSSISLNTGLKALISAQFVLETVGHNIANANVDGYSRQRVRLNSSLPLNVGGLLIGSGVDASSSGWRPRSLRAAAGRKSSSND